MFFRDGRPYAMKTFKNKAKSEAAVSREIGFQKLAANAGVSPRVVHSGRDAQGRLFFIMDALHETLSSVAEKACVHGDVRSKALMMTAEPQMIMILKVLNGLGILHNDSSAVNFMFDRSGRMYVIDFGMSKKITNVTNTSPEIMGARLLSLTRTIPCGGILTREALGEKYFPIHSQAAAQVA